MISEIENRPEVQETVEVLRRLEFHGIKEAAIAAGWTRTLIAGGSTSDIDVSYVGNIPYPVAREVLKDVLDTVKPSNKAAWDIEGIWNAETAYGVTHTVDNFLLYYLNSIDSVYLASDGKLHDPTGMGFEDAKTLTLRVNEYDRADGRIPTPTEEVNVCLENCRRLAKFGWLPTSASVQRIQEGVSSWSLLSDDEKDYFTGKLRKKYLDPERGAAQSAYEKYGWGFIFSL